MYVIVLSVYVYAPRVCSICGGQKISNPLELEYQSVRQISDTVDTVNSTKVFSRSVSGPHHCVSCHMNVLKQKW